MKPSIFFYVQINFSSICKDGNIPPSYVGVSKVRESSQKRRSYAIDDDDGHDDGG